MPLKLLKISLPLLLACALLTGCWQTVPAESEALTPLPSTEEPTDTTPSRTILPEIFSLPYAPDQALDPITCPDGMQQTVSSLLYEGLFRLNAQLEPELWLCESYSYTPGTEEDASCSYTFQLRSDVTFSDGTPLTADDVKATWNRARNSERYGARLAGVRSITAEETTLTVTLSSPNTGFPALLDIPIVKSGTEEAIVPTGTGPYLFSTTDTASYLVANQTWWRDENRPVDLILLAEAADRDTMLYRFTSHDVQLVTVDLTGTNPISATGNVSFQDAHTTILQYIGCNTAQAPLNNAAFRRALGMGFNRSHIVSAFLSGHGVAAQFPVSPVTGLYPTDLEQRYSLDAFTAALAECGYTAERTLTLLVNSENSFKVAISQHLAKTYTAAGVPVEVRALPWEEYTAAISAGDFDLYYGEVKLTADWDLSDLLGSTGTLNYSGRQDPLTDQLLSDFAAADDRAGAMKSLCSHLKLQSPILPVCFKSTSVLMQTSVLENLTSTMAEPFYGLTDCTVHLQN